MIGHFFCQPPVKQAFKKTILLWNSDNQVYTMFCCKPGNPRCYIALIAVMVSCLFPKAVHQNGFLCFCIRVKPVFLIFIYIQDQ